MKLLYFAWLRQKIGVGEETIDLPADIADARGLVTWLKGRGEGYEIAFRDLDAIKLAVNQDYADLDAPVKAGDEVAFFPPVTGG
ncbi:molybdopterin converting factor subunit 1 [Marivibrio halodurans]|uniref:Molybdopterin synthase sulfur carrier subunit n=1 Tax=Marivibrio halodurans TaxID=2039722 RepID=A0A8J7V0C6_9PROT|nr:molybdopterin converting factor subunit 1 [Marivibrio halodurans]MBP5856666.1 molybdopterin converting factor subunit 1 [Marivibrio halodurans]